jgi:hypothetical protein
MVEPESNEESSAVIVPLSGITTIFPAAGLGIKIRGTSIAASNANTPTVIMMVLFFTPSLLSVFL